jgi:hypothetical protein
VRIRKSVIGLVVTLGSVAALVPATPAHACTGEVCDSFCAFWTWDSGNTKVNNLTPGPCPVR